MFVYVDWLLTLKFCIFPIKVTNFCDILALDLACKSSLSFSRPLFWNFYSKIG